MRSPPWIWGKSAPGKGNSKCKGPEVGMILESSCNRIDSIWPDFKGQSKGWCVNEVGNVARLSRVLVSG